MTPAVFFTAAMPTWQPGRPGQLAKVNPRNSVDRRQGSSVQTEAAGDFLMPTEVHRGETLAADHGAISGNRAVGFTYLTRGNA